MTIDYQRPLNPNDTRKRFSLLTAIGFPLCMAGPFTGMIGYRFVELYWHRTPVSVVLAIVSPIALGWLLTNLALIMTLFARTPTHRGGRLALVGTILATLWICITQYTMTLG